MPAVLRWLPISLGLLVACSGTPRRATEPEPEPAPMDAGVDAPAPDAPLVYEDETAPDGPSCTRTADCESGLACRGPRGCRTDWACGAPVVCGDDRIAYCGCDGTTFYAASGCPNQPYDHVGACEDGALAEVEYGIPDYDELPTTEDRICTTNADCRRGETCFGPSSCGATLRCQRVRGCAGRRETFCGCDGETFEAPSACPGRAFLRRGECEGAVAVAVAEIPDAGTDAGTRIASRPDAGVDGGVRVASRPDAGTDAGPEMTADGRRVCRSNRDCRRPEICAGPPGCGETWTCTSPRDVVEGGRCETDTQYFCDCERETFVASMTCPGRMYAHRGSCEIDRLLDLAGGSTH